MQRTSFAAIHCSLARTLDIVGEWWTPLVLRDVALGVRRFDDIHHDLGVSRKVLAQRLDTLVASGVLERRPYQDKPLRHDYVLTDKGASLIPALTALMAWGDRWTADQDGPPLRLWHRTCGQETEPTVSCSRCRQPISYEDLVARPGPGARIAPGTNLIAQQLRQPTEGGSVG